MKSKYDGIPGKEASTQAARQSRLSKEHQANNAFTKSAQADQAKYAGKDPKLSTKSMQFNAYMSNNGESAQEFARTLTKGIDKSAFPVK